MRPVNIISHEIVGEYAIIISLGKEKLFIIQLCMFLVAEIADGYYC